MQFHSLLACASFAMAAAASGADTGAVRIELQRAYEAATADSITKHSDSASLRNYVLYPYLQQQRIQLALVQLGQVQLNLAASNDKWAPIDQAAEEFIKTHGTDPVARELRRTWYASLAKREEWERYLANYRETDDPTLRCHALTARVKLQQLEGLAPLVVQLWTSAPGSLPACEIVFDWLKTQSAWTPALIERRAKAALEGDNPAFARQMIALLPKEMAAPLEQWASLMEQPQSSIDAAISNPDTSLDSNALVDGWTRLARGNQDAAMTRYANLVKAQKLDAPTASRLALELALPLSWSRRSEALNYFSKVRTAEFDDRAWEWYARSAIWNGNWQLAANIIGLMPGSLRSQTRWKYWLARSTSELGDKAAAQTQYAPLMGDDNYYAALAAARLEKTYTPDQRTFIANDSQIQTIAAGLPFQRARELILTTHQELRESAYDEWRLGYNKLGPEARAQAVILASRWGWHDQAILIAAEQRLFNDYKLLYPHAFDEEVASAAKISGLPRSIIYAVLRQESIFRTDAVSSAGARGLMQVLPEVATRTARRWKLASPGDLFEPQVNIPIGAAHLKDIVDRFNGRTILALAGYNAGPNAVARWVSVKPKESDVWIENIPFNETRTYVQRVLWHSIVFGWLASNEGQDSKGWLTTIVSEN